MRPIPEALCLLLQIVQAPSNSPKAPAPAAGELAPAASASAFQTPLFSPDSLLNPMLSSECPSEFTAYSENSSAAISPASTVEVTICETAGLCGVHNAVSKLGDEQAGWVTAT